MPSNAHSERTDATGGSSSKSSLLWAYQLRREHVHLVERIDGIDLRILSCTQKAEACEQNVSNLESLVKSLQTENYTLQNEVTVVRAKLTTKIEGIGQQMNFLASGSVIKDATKKLELENQNMALQMSELSKSMAGLKKEIADLSCQRDTCSAGQLNAMSEQINRELPKTESGSVRIETRPRFIVRLKYIKDKGQLDYVQILQSV